MIMQLASILDQYHDAFQAKYGSRLLPGHLRAIDAISRCRTPEAGQSLFVQCNCGHADGDPAPVGIAAARNARIMKPRCGWIVNRKSCCQLSTSWQPLRFPVNSDSWPGITKSSFTTFFLHALPAR
jgi:hypothetical protein